MSDSTTQPNPAEEIDRLREHNRQLLAELKAAKADVKAASEAATDAQKARDDWRARWYEMEVATPLESDLRLRRGTVEVSARRRDGTRPAQDGSR